MSPELDEPFFSELDFLDMGFLPDLCMPLFALEVPMLLPDIEPDELLVEAEPMLPDWAEAPAANASVAAQASAILIIGLSPKRNEPCISARVAALRAYYLLGGFGMIWVGMVVNPCSHGVVSAICSPVKVH